MQSTSVDVRCPVAFIGGLRDDVFQRGRSHERPEQMQPESLIVEVYGTPGSIEYQAALLLRDMIRDAAGPEDSGWVAIHTDLYFPGQKREQIDLLLHAHFPNGFTRRLRLDGAEGEQDVTFQDIVAVIEVKAHRRENVLFSGTNVEVLYDDVWKSASAQSHEQVHSVKPFLKRELGWSPYVCNLIFFTGLFEKDLPFGSRNYLARDSSYVSLLERLCLSRKLTASPAQRGVAVFSCVSASDPDLRSAKNEQLRRLLHTERIVTEPPPAPPKPSYTPRPYQQMPYLPPAPFQPAWRAPRRRTGRTLFKLLIAVLVLAWIITVATRKEFPSTQAAHFSPATQTAAPVLRTCTMVTSSCYCDTKTSFRKGRTVTVQFIAKQQRPESSVVREPDGNTVPLRFRNLNLSPKYFNGSCFVAKYTLRKDAPLGSYSVQTTAVNTDGSAAGAISIGFQVTR